MDNLELIEIIKGHCEGCKNNIGIECIGRDKEGKCWEMKQRIIMSLRKIQEYEAIGTVEECREAVEKQKAKKPINRSAEANRNGIGKYYDCDVILCPSCKKRLRVKFKGKYCDKCGQALDW